MIAEVDMYPHDGAHSAILLDGPYLYLNTGNGVDNTHAVIRRPDAPTLIALDKTTGRVVAVDKERIGPHIFHATWSSPAMAAVNGNPLLFLGGPDGVVYAFNPLDKAAIPPTVQHFERVWRFDCDPGAPKENISSYLRNRQVSPSNIKSSVVFYKDRIYVTGGGDIWWGKEEAWLKCIDATQTGDVTETAERWTYPLQMHTCATPAISDGLVFVTDSGKLVHCVDAETGQPYWTHEMKRDLWGSVLAADGKVYVGSRGGDFVILAADKTKKVLATLELDAEIASTPVAANGVLYINTLKTLYAVQESAGE
jgi:outer membrane protein assembly factor BamB